MTYAAILDNVLRLEDLFSDPWDASNLLGFAASIEADELGRMSPAGEIALDGFCINAEFVPVAHGGRFVDLGRLIALMRTVFRRDPCLGLGYGASFFASVDVWAAGDAGQQRCIATHLLANRKLACCYHGFAHGNDIDRAAWAASIDGDTAMLNCVKQVIVNISRADESRGARSHSLFPVERAATSPRSVRDLPRCGMRGTPLGGIKFDDCRIDVATRYGASGNGMEPLLKAFQLSRIALPGMFSGIVDTGLRVALRHARHRKLYGRAVTDLPLVRAQLAETFADLIMCDCFCTVAANAALLLPGELSLHAASIGAFVPGVLIGAMNNLASVVGAHSYLREGDMAIFQKLLRDLQPVASGHTSRMNCLMSILWQLPVAARGAWSADVALPTALFTLDGDGGTLSFSALSNTTGWRDSLASQLRRFARDGSDAQVPEIAAWIARLAAEFDALAAHCAQLLPTDLTPDATPKGFALASRYVALLAATACIGVWRAQRHRGDTFLSQPVWLLAALHRIGALLGDPRIPLSEQLYEAIFDELEQRYDDNLSFDLRAHRLAASRSWH